MQSDLNCVFSQHYNVSGGHVCNKQVCHGALESGLGSSISSMDMHWVNNGNNCSSVTSNDSDPPSLLINTGHVKYDCHDLAPVSEEEDNDGMMGLWNKFDESNKHLDQLPWRNVNKEIEEDLEINFANTLEVFDPLKLSDNLCKCSLGNSLRFGQLSLYDDLYKQSHNTIDQFIHLYDIPNENAVDLDKFGLSNDLCTFSLDHSNQCVDACCINHDNNDEFLTFFNPVCDHLTCSSHYHPWLTISNDFIPSLTTDDSIAHLENPWKSDTLLYPVLSPMCHDIHNSIRKSDICHNHISCMNNNNDIFYRRQSFQNSSCNMRSINVCENRANIFDGDNNEEQVQVTAAERVVEWLKLITSP